MVRDRVRGGARAKLSVRVRGKVRVSVQCLEPQRSATHVEARRLHT